MNYVLERIFCKASFGFDSAMFFVKLSNDGVFVNHNVKGPSCLKDLVYVNEKELLNHLKRKNNLLLITYRCMNKSDTLINEKTVVISLSKISKKYYTRKNRVREPQADFEVIIIKNVQSDEWEIKKINYPPRLAPMIKNQE